MLPGRVTWVARPNLLHCPPGQENNVDENELRDAALPRAGLHPSDPAVRYDELVELAKECWRLNTAAGRRPNPFAARTRPAIARAIRREIKAAQRLHEPVCVGLVDTRTTVDWLRQNPPHFTYTAVTLDPEYRNAFILQHSAAPGVGIPADIRHGVTVRFRALPDDNNTPGDLDADEVIAYLEGPRGQILLGRICDGHTVSWDGSNQRGRLTADAEAAIELLRQDLAALPRGLEPVLYDGWLEYPDDLTEQEVGPETTDRQVDQLTYALTLSAETDGVRIVNPERLYQRLIALRDARLAWAEEEG